MTTYNLLLLFITITIIIVIQLKQIHKKLIKL